MLAVLSIGFIGCAGTSGTTGYVDHTTGDDAIYTDNVHLRSDLELQTLSLDTINGLRRVTYSLADRKLRTLRIKYRVLWFSENGAEIAPQTKRYKYLTLTGRNATTFSDTAPSPLAVSAKIHIMYAGSGE